MIYKTKEQLQMEEDQLKEEGVTYHKWNDKTDIKGTGKYQFMPKGTLYKGVHKILAKLLVSKGYAEKA